MADGTESVDIKLPTGETISALVPHGWSDQQIHSMLLMKHPEFFHTNAPTSEAQAAAMPPVAPNMPASQMQTSSLPGIASGAASALPVAGAVLGGVAGSIEPGGGNIAGAALGGAGGEQLRRIIQGESTTNKGALTATAGAGATGAAGEMGGQILGKAIPATMNFIKGGPTKDWQAINEAIGASKTSVRIPKSATSLEDAVTMPARGLEKEGFDAKALSGMSPLEQQAAVAPKWHAAGKAVDQTAIDATAKNVTLDSTKSAIKVAESIKNPALQDKAVQQLSDLMEEVGIRDPRQITPVQALQLRRAMSAGARFGPNGDLSSLGGIRAKLYGAVSGDLTEAVPGFNEIDQHYSDLNSAMKAINNSASKAAVTPDATRWDIMKNAMKKAGIAMGGGALGAAGAGSLYEIYKIAKGAP